MNISIEFIWKGCEFDAAIDRDNDGTVYIDKLFMVVGKARQDVSGLLEFVDVAEEFNEIVNTIYQDDAEDDDIYRAEVDQLFDIH